MEFVISRVPEVVPDPNFGVMDTSEHVYTWKLIAATGPVAQSPEEYPSEALARGAIAQFKRSASGVRFAKVVTS